MIKRDGYTIIPLSCYFNKKGIVKINLGFAKNTAKSLINDTFRGSLNLLNSNNISAEKMVETVATRGGTTEAGIKKMKINKVDNIFNQVFKAAYARAKQQGDGK